MSRLIRGAEFAAWWAGLTALWLVLVTSVDLLTSVVGACCAAAGAWAATAARRAAGSR
ncbi:hypothetical protein ACOKM3_02305 [Streptomyces sp. BH106]|uniref:hypothetical protein n=1 Tax=Streptomyces sp. BH106 TaxID=3410409 RepID=UPI003CF1E8A4